MNLNIYSTIQNRMNYCYDSCMTNGVSTINITCPRSTWDECEVNGMNGRDLDRVEMYCNLSCDTIPIAIPFGVIAIVSALALKKMGLLTFDSDRNRCAPLLTFVFVYCPAMLSFICAAPTMAYGVNYAFADQPWFINMVNNQASQRKN